MKEGFADSALPPVPVEVDEVEVIDLLFALLELLAITPPLLTVLVEGCLTCAGGLKAVDLGLGGVRGHSSEPNCSNLFSSFESPSSSVSPHLRLG